MSFTNNCLIDVIIFGKNTRIAFELWIFNWEYLHIFFLFQFLQLSSTVWSNCIIITCYFKEVENLGLPQTLFFTTMTHGYKYATRWSCWVENQLETFSVRKNHWNFFHGKKPYPTYASCRIQTHDLPVTQWWC